MTITLYDGGALERALCPQPVAAEVTRRCKALWRDKHTTYLQDASELTDSGRRPSCGRLRARRATLSLSGTTARICIVLCLALGAVSLAPAAQLTRDGQPAAVLVVPDSARQAREAADRIQKGIAAMSGATLPIVSESAAAPAGMLPIHVGPTRFAASKGLRQRDLKPEEVVVIATDQHVIVLGNEGPAGPSRKDIQQGTIFAAVSLLEQLGCRWLWPDPSGHVIPKTTNVVLPNGEYRHAPKVVDRGMRLQVGMASFFPNVIAKFDRKPHEYPLHDWPIYARLGGSRDIRAGHSFGNWYERFFKTHPEYFATAPDGGFSWLHIPDRAKLCVSNPGVLEQVVADAKAAYQAADNKNNVTYSVMPNDGQGFCCCPNCRAMDNPNGRKESWLIYNNKTKKTETFTHVSLSDRYTKFWNKIAERLEKEAPGLTLGTCAYSVYRAKPLDVQRLHPSLAVGYVGGGYSNTRQRDTLMKDWNDWSSLCRQMFWRPNFMKEGEGFPLVWATRMGNDLRYLISTGLVGVEMPNVHHHWGTQGLNYYMLARLMWDHTLEPSAVIDDYCRTGFGAAAPVVRQYVARLEQLSEQFAQHEASGSGDLGAALADDEDPDARRGRAAGPRKQGPSSWDVVWTDAAMAELDGLLTKASAAVKAGTPEATRVAILREGLDFAKAELPVRRAIDRHAANESKEAEFDLLLAVANVEQWLLAHRDSKAVGVVEGAPYWWRGKRDTKLFSRQSILGRAERAGGAGNRYVLTVPAYSQKGRFVTIEFSADGKIWSQPEPYRVRHDYTAPAGAKSVFARLTFKGPDGVTPQKPIDIPL